MPLSKWDWDRGRSDAIAVKHFIPRGLVWNIAMPWFSFFSFASNSTRDNQEESEVKFGEEKSISLLGWQMAGNRNVN